MKTSNKLLLGVFLAAILALTGTHIALYAKYKAGDFESVADIEKEMYIIHKIPTAIKTVQLVGFDNCSVGHTGEAAMKLPKHESLKRMSMSVRNDTLLMIADTTLTEKHFEQGLRNHQLVWLTIPKNISLRLDASAVNLSGAPTPADTASYNIQLNPGSRFSVTERYPSETPTYFGRLNINANYSKIELDDYTNINELNLTAQNSDLQAHRAAIKNIHLNIDDNTIISSTKKGLQNIQLAKP